MKIKIESDAFEIVERLKEIDENYFIIYDTTKRKYEVHNTSQYLNTYCFTYPYENLDKRLIDLAKSTSIDYIDNIIEEIDKNNIDMEMSSNNFVKNQSDYMFNEIAKFSQNSSKDFDEAKAFTSKWR